MQEDVKRSGAFVGSLEEQNVSPSLLGDASDHKLARLLYELYRLTEDETAIMGEKTGVLL